MANPFPFVAGDVLTAAEMNGIGEATAYTPTFTNITVGNGTVDFRFVQVQKLVFVDGSIKFGSTTSISGNPNITLPVTAVAPLDFPSLGLSNFLDVGTLRVQGAVTFVTTTTAGIRVFTTSGTLIGTGTINATSPFTWTTNDVINCSFTYQAA